MPIACTDIKSCSPKCLATDLKTCMLSLKSFCTKQARRIQRKLKKMPFTTILEGQKRLVDTLKCKASVNSCMSKKKAAHEEADEENAGIWQKRILMGTKCQPLDFSGVIYYDTNGKQVNKCDGQE